MLNTNGSRIAICIAAMVAVVLLSNILVQFPVHGMVGPVALADILTYGAFTYPVAFLITDLTNRWLGPNSARRVVLAGFVVAVGFSIMLATPRIAIASGSAFLIAQFLDVQIFDRMRQRKWWVAPLISSTIGSIIDTALFFSIAFSASFSFIGPNDAFAIEAAPVFGVFSLEAARWISWAVGDLAVKLIFAVLMLLPFGFFRRVLTDANTGSLRPV